MGISQTHGVALVQIYNAGLKRAARSSLKIQDAKNCQKFAICAPLQNFVSYIFATKVHIDSQKKLVKQQYLPNMFLQYGELAAEIGLGHPS